MMSMLKVAIVNKTKHFMEQIKAETDERKKLALWDDYMAQEKT